MPAGNAGFGDREIFDAGAQATANRILNRLLAAYKLEEQGALPRGRTSRVDGTARPC
jgi:hypothetical protein